MKEADHSSDEYKGTGYEVFILLLSALSVFNIIFYLLPDLVPAATEIVGIIDLFISLVFMADFLFRFFTYDSKYHYFFKNWGWADLLSAVPFPIAKIFRLFRIIRIVYVMRKNGVDKIRKEVSKNRAEVALFFILIFIIIIIELSSVLVVQFESVSPKANILTGGDAIWWACVTVTTVGYGDFYPVTVKGRIVGIVLMISGVSVFGTLAGFLSTKLVSRKEDTGPDPEITAKIGEIHSLLKECRGFQDDLSSRIGELENNIPGKEKK
ncbi:potassium channel family protein [Methanolacinia paynteri]|uniref:potassium channel family protein n=1 Tax=Methanolacinia paynteri TaxID=230356 RepID=UPI00064E4683|nr:potassium channel family protein [Methanolacinia paynteri]